MRKTTPTKEAKIHPAVAQAIQDPNLKEIDLHLFNLLENDFLVLAEHCPNIERLVLPYHWYPMNGILTDLLKLPKLTSLRMDHLWFNHVNFECLSALVSDHSHFYK